MDKKNAAEGFKADISAEEEVFKFGIASSLTINMIKGKSIYSFAMPMGSKLDECEEACGECLKIVKKMKLEGELKKSEAIKKEEAIKKALDEKEEEKKEAK